jgi:cephalosporin hydroxylase
MRDERGMKFYRDTVGSRYTYNFEWLGRPYIQMPQDMIGIQEVIWQVKPDFIIETGIAHGGGLVFCASILEALGHGYVFGIDVDIRQHNRKEIENHRMFKRIVMHEGSSTDMAIYSEIFQRIGQDKKVVVILDSDHTHDHVLKELNIYKDIVSVGSYLICLDTIIQFLPEMSYPDRGWYIGNNPWTAVQEFLKVNKNFKNDESIEDRLLITSAPGGCLRRIL